MSVSKKMAARPEELQRPKSNDLFFCTAD